MVVEQHPRPNHRSTSIRRQTLPLPQLLAVLPLLDFEHWTEDPPLVVKD